MTLETLFYLLGIIFITGWLVFLLVLSVIIFLVSKKVTLAKAQLSSSLIGSVVHGLVQKNTGSKALFISAAAALSAEIIRRLAKRR